MERETGDSNVSHLAHLTADLSRLGGALFMTSALNPSHPNFDDIELPCRPGDWLMNKGNHRVAKVKAVYRDSRDGEVLVDIWLYGWDGERTGRESRAMGGPRTFEPACDYASWHRIEAPCFPMQLKWVDEDAGRIARYYATPKPDGKFKRRKARHLYGTVRPQNTPEADINLAYKIAADELRDIVREKKLTGDARDRVLERATELERKANG